jgi:dTDP-4-dehydrorhamnose 3,5-epimerase-like enzyme
MIDKKIYTIESIKIIDLPYYNEENGDLVVIEGLLNVPFQIARVFLVRSSNNNIRGQHAHKSCTQFLTCSRGAIDVFCTDGINKIKFELNHPKIGLLIPPSIWAEQKYKTNDASLTVLCDKNYDEDDYIRNYEKYIEYRSK